MIHMTKFHVGLLIVICTIEFIDASCLSYGHSCWGAHGKRSYIPQREQNQETKPGELNDQWGLFKIVPERKDIYRLKGQYQGNQQMQYPDNRINSLNFPTIEHQESSSEEISPNTIKDASSSIERILQEHEDFPQKQTPLRQRVPLIENMKSYQIMRLNKANFEQ